MITTSRGLLDKVYPELVKSLIELNRSLAILYCRSRKEQRVHSGYKVFEYKKWQNSFL